MSINKIKLKQIDADFPSLVGEYGSGYFATTGQLNSLSGASFKYADEASRNFVYRSGSQDISGVKNFLSRPNLSGQGLARLNEVVTLSTSQTINGAKNFDIGNVTFSNNEVSYEFSSLNFTENSFVFDSTSLSNLASAFGNTFVNTTTNQTIGGTKNFTTIPRVNNTGVLLSGQINPIYVSGANSNGTRYITFVLDSGNEFKSMQLNTGLRYSPAEQSISCNLFRGTLSGLASGANTANTAALATTATRLSGKNPIATINGLPFDGSSDIIVSGSGNVDSTNINRFLLFTSGSSNGYKDLRFNSNIIVNPALNMIGASTFSGGFSGNVLNATSSAALSLGTFSSTDNINFQFPAGTTMYQLTSTFFAPISDNVRALGQSARRWSVVFAGTATINTSDRNLKTEISEIPDEWLDAWQEVNYTRYKFKDAVEQKGLSGARWHIGLIAQEIYEKFQNRGLNALEIGMLCYDKWDSYTDPDGKIIPSGEMWSIRADECQFMEAALMRRSLNRLTSGNLI